MANALPSLARLSLRGSSSNSGPVCRPCDIGKVVEFKGRNQLSEEGARFQGLNEDNEPWCIICHDTFETGREGRDAELILVLSNCKHAFHLTCMQTVAEYSFKTSCDMTCPKCSTELTDTEKVEVGFRKDAVPEMELDWDRRADKDTMLVVLRALRRLPRGEDDPPLHVLAEPLLEPLNLLELVKLYDLNMDSDYGEINWIDVDELLTEYTGDVLHKLAEDTMDDFMDIFMNDQDVPDTDEDAARHADRFFSLWNKRWVYMQAGYAFVVRNDDNSRFHWSFNFFNGFQNTKTKEVDDDYALLTTRPGYLAQAEDDCALQNMIYFWARGLTTTKAKTRILHLLLLEEGVPEGVLPLFVPGIPIVRQGEGIPARLASALGTWDKQRLRDVFGSKDQIQTRIDQDIRYKWIAETVFKAAGWSLEERLNEPTITRSRTL